MIRFILNDQLVETDLPAGTTLLDLIRYDQHLTGTKIGCREGDCGACTVLIGSMENNKIRYRSMTSCLLPLGNAAGKHIVTIEGINFPGQLNMVQEAMAEAGATQCGFCTPGFVVSLTGYCLQDETPSGEKAIASVDGNICRCTGYKSIERASMKINDLLLQRKEESAMEFAINQNCVPEYFKQIPSRLAKIQTVETKNIASGVRAGGGTDLYVQRHDEMTNSTINFLFDTPSLKGITEENGRIVFGPSTTVTDMMESSLIRESFPKFHRFAKLVSSTPIRNMATLAGNFVNASPIGDFTIFFLSLDAQLKITSAPSANGHSRIVALRDFYKGYKQLELQSGETIEQFWINLPPKDAAFNFEKVSKRTHLDIASVNSAILLELNDQQITRGGISAGGVGPIPMFLRKTSGIMQGKKISEELVMEIIDSMRSEISPISDARGTREYKTQLLSQLIKAHFIELFPGIINFHIALPGYEKY